MKRVSWAVLAALCVAAAFLVWRFGAGHAQPADSGEAIRALPATGESGESAAEARKTGPQQPQDTQTSVPQPDYAAQLRAAPDYLAFVRSLLGAARAGDHVAQLYIFRAFDYCNDGYRAYFGRPEARRTLDDALKRQAMRWPYETEEVRRVYIRCHALMESDAKDLGEPVEWLRLASDGGNPLAQVLFAQQQWRATIGADDAVKTDERRRLVAMAIRSREPEVIWEIGSTPLELGPDGAEVGAEYLSWYLAACQRGLDCSPQSDIVRQLCRFDPNCQPFESVADVLRRGNENEFPEIEARARTINEKIDAGDWEALGF